MIKGGAAAEARLVDDRQALLLLKTVGRELKRCGGGAEQAADKLLLQTDGLIDRFVAMGLAGEESEALGRRQHDIQGIAGP